MPGCQNHSPSVLTWTSCSSTAIWHFRYNFSECRAHVSVPPLLSLFVFPPKPLSFSLLCISPAALVLQLLCSPTFFSPLAITSASLADTSGTEQPPFWFWFQGVLPLFAVPGLAFHNDFNLKAGAMLMQHRFSFRLNFSCACRSRKK